MFQLQLPWWDLPLRAALIYLALLAMVRLSGKRTIGQYTPFDLLVVMLLSEGASNALTAGDESVAAALLVTGTLIALNATLGWLSARFDWLQKVVDSEAVLIGRDGRWFQRALRRNRLSQADVEEALREHDCALHEMRCAFLEADGRISVLKETGKAGAGEGNRTLV